jgi:uncharacterized protein YjbJ (UPF0337 family)
MNENNFEGNWDEFKGKIQTKWGKLTDDDMEQLKGNIRELKGKLKQKYGYTQEKAKAEASKFLEKLNSKIQ